MGDHPTGLVPCEDDRELGWAADAFNARDEFELSIENLLVKEKQRTEGLILSRGGDVQVRSEVAEEGSDFGLAHFFRVPLLVEKDVSPDPIEIRLLCAKAVMLDPVRWRRRRAFR